MALMINLDDAMDILIRLMKDHADGEKDCVVVYDETDLEWIRNELEQKCYHYLTQNRDKDIFELSQQIEALTIDNLAFYLKNGKLDKWIQQMHDTMQGYLLRISQTEKDGERK